jgi:hypothetical protein
VYAGALSGTNAQTLFVLTNPGGSGAGNITVGNTRQGAAIAIGVSVGTLTQNGWPAMDLGSLTNPGLVNSTIRGIDVEGICPGVYMETGAQNTLEFTSATAGTYNLIERLVGLTLVNNLAGSFGMDVDVQSAVGTQFTGNRNTLFGPSRGSPGLFFDGIANQFGLNIVGNTSNGDITGCFDKNAIRPTIGFGVATGSMTATGSIGPPYGGCWSLEQAGAATYTLFTAQADTTFASSSKGMMYEFVSVGAGNATIKPSANAAGNYINDNSGLVNNQVLLTTGQWARFICLKSTTNSRLYWAVMTNGTIS